MLSGKQKRFCEEYVIDLNATAAYMRAGYSSRTSNAAGVEANRLLRNPKIQAYIQKLRDTRSQRTEITSDRVLLEIAKLAFSNVTDVVSFSQSGVEIKNSSDLSSEVKGAIAEIISEQTEFSTKAKTEVLTKVKVKMHDKLGALKELMKHLGLTNDFNCAIATLRNKYGLTLRRDANDRWIVDDASITPIEEDEEIL